jgi:hypothetical protein
VREGGSISQGCACCMLCAVLLRVRVRATLFAPTQHSLCPYPKHNQTQKLRRPLVRRLRAVQRDCPRRRAGGRLQALLRARRGRRQVRKGRFGAVPLQEERPAAGVRARVCVASFVLRWRRDAGTPPNSSNPNKQKQTKSKQQQ